VFKYDWYDPNTAISGNEVKNAGDILRHNFGAGLLWNINAALRLTCYYDFVSNEQTDNTSDAYNRSRQDNVLTLRLQYKF
jgi:phosphate-selective porin